MELVDVLLAVDAGTELGAEDLQEAIEGGLIRLANEADASAGLVVAGEVTVHLDEYNGRVARAKQAFADALQSTTDEGWAVVAVNSLDPDVCLTFGRDEDERWSRPEAESHAIGLGRADEAVGYVLHLESPAGEWSVIDLRALEAALA